MESREYRYRKHIRWGQYVFPLLFGILLAVIWIALLVVCASRGEGLSPTAWGLLGLVTTFISIEGAVVWFAYYRMAGIYVSIDEKAVRYRNRSGTTTIPFESISRLEFPSVKYVGGWLKIVSEAKTIRLTVVFEGIGHFVQELKSALDSNGLSSVYDRDRFTSFFTTAVYSDLSWERLYKIFWTLTISTILGAVIGCLVALLTGLDRTGVATFGLISGGWPSLIYLYTELVFARTTGEALGQTPFVYPEQSAEFEAKTYRNAIKLGSGVYAAVLVALVVLGSQ